MNRQSEYTAWVEPSLNKTTLKMDHEPTDFKRAALLLREAWTFSTRRLHELNSMSDSEIDELYAKDREMVTQCVSSAK